MINQKLTYLKDKLELLTLVLSSYVSITKYANIKLI